MNSVQLVGNLGADLELRHTKSGTAVVNLRLATQESRPAGEGQWEKFAAWHTIVEWGNKAETCAKYLRKGSRVGICGRLTYRSYTDRDGNDRTSTEVTATEVEFLNDKPQSDGRRQQSAPVPYDPGRCDGPPGGSDNIPF